ncbi:hypothetical protein NQZ68_036471 [Dissostichus eleginoides]|nr:hypothetical protein NQZ68_036471 [Dissostichus eleginoides]
MVDSVQWCEGVTVGHEPQSPMVDSVQWGVRGYSPSSRKLFPPCFYSEGPSSRKLFPPCFYSEGPSSRKLFPPCFYSEGPSSRKLGVLKMALGLAAAPRLFLPRVFPAVLPGFPAGL